MELPEERYPAIDGDPILYRCGFAAEQRIYECNGEDFLSKRDLIDAYGKDAEYTFRKEAEPLENALANVRSVMEGILETTQADNYSVFISSNTPTFRDDRAMIRPYKGNRAEMEKPIHYRNCYEYLMDTWKAEPVFGIEADDALAIHQTEMPDKSIIVSTDKDLWQVPGWHYNWTKEDEGIFYINPEEARHWKYVQILCGDATDNIEGLPGIGEKRAGKILQLQYGSPEEEYDEICRNYYFSYFADTKENRFLKMSPADYLNNVLHMTSDEVYEETKALITLITKEADLEEQEERDSINI